MNQETFEKKIKQELQKLDREQVVRFAWRCAMRALPFLGGSGSFNFWDKENRQKYIYAIFYGLDVSAAARAANRNNINLVNSVRHDFRL
jgi:hypothetical protein